MKEERFPRTRKDLRGQRLRVAEGGSFGATEESTATGVRRAKRRDSHKEARRRAALTSPRGSAAHPPGWEGLGAEARVTVGSQGEDWGWRREHSLKGLAHHSWLGGSPGKSLQLPKRQETFSSLFVSWSARRGDSERRLNELQKLARAAAISADPRGERETLGLLLPPPRSLCASPGHSPHRPSREPVQPATARAPGSGDNIPGRMHCAPQAAATSCWPLTPQAHPASSVPLPPRGLGEPEPPKQLLL